MLTEKNRKGILFACWLILVAVAAGIGWHSINYAWSVKPPCDGSIFAVAAKYAFNGRRLYTDVFDNKPPMIHIFNGTAMTIGDGTFMAVRQLERIFAVIGAVTLIAVTGLMFGSLVASGLALLVFCGLLYSPLVFENGNMTEEYASVTWLLALLSALLSFRARRNVAMTLVFLCGSFVSVSLMLKEPYLLGSLPVLGYLFFKQKNEENAIIAKRFFFATSGVLLPGILVLLWLWWMGSLTGWIDVISYNFVYSSEGKEIGYGTRVLQHLERTWQTLISQSYILMLLLISFIPTLCSRLFLIKTFYAPWFILASLMANFIGITLSGRLFGHYYIQLVPSLALASACGASFIFQGLSYKLAKIDWRWPVIVFFVFSVFVDRHWLVRVRDRLLVPAGTGWHGGPIGDAIKQKAKPGDSMWVTAGTDASYYLDANLYSPTRCLGLANQWFPDTWLSTGKEKIRQLQDDLLTRSPAFVVVVENPDADLSKYDLSGWLDENYYNSGISEHKGKAKLFLRNEIVTTGSMDFN